MAETAVGNATAINQKNPRARCYEKLSVFYDKIFHFRRSAQQSSNNQGVISSTEDASRHLEAGSDGGVELADLSIEAALRHLEAESDDGADLADHIMPWSFSLVLADGDIKGDTFLHDAARRADSNAIDVILNGGRFSHRKNFKKAVCRKRNEFGNTALHEAVMKGHVEGVQLLFSADGLVAHYPNKECKSPLYLAIENRNKQIVDVLLSSVSSFLYEHIWRQQQQSSNAVTEGIVETSHDLLIKETRKRELEVQEMQRQGQPSSSHLLKLPLENYKREEILGLEFYKAIEQGDVSNLASLILNERCNRGVFTYDIVHGVSSIGDTLLHMAVRSERQEMVEFIAFHFPQFLTRRNIKGDTPLHVTASTGSLHNMIIILSCYAKHFGNGFYTETLCRIRNKCGNTALHEAVMKNHVEGASLLLSVDRVEAHYLNAEGKSPLYLAVENDSKELVHVLLHAPFGNVDSHQGKSPLHAAILERKSGGLIKKLLDKRPEDLELVQLRDQKGGNPLHCAALIGDLEAVRTLVKARPLLALEHNTKGYLPIHVASKKGRVKVVKEIVKQESLDPLAMLNLKLQNILHIAAKKGKHTLVSYILSEKKLEKLLNEKDINGNTPLHLASKNLFPMVLLMLTQDERVKVKLINNQHMSSRDVIEPKRWKGFHRIRVILSVNILRSAGTPTSQKASRSRRSTFHEQIESSLNNDISTLMLVAALVATVTFTAGFTMPGGFNTSEDSHPKERGMPTLANRKMFQVFTICDAIAMYSSIFAIFLMMWTRIGDFNVARGAICHALSLVFISLLTMSIAFMAGLHVVLDNLSWLASAVIIIGTIFLSLFLLGFIVLVFPLGSRAPILRHIGRFIWRISIPFTGGFKKLPKKKKTKELEQQSQKEKYEEDEIEQVRINMP